MGIVVLLLFFVWMGAGVVAADLVAITNLATLKRWMPQAAEGAVRVRLTGVVTARNPSSGGFYVQEQGDAVFVAASPLHAEVEPGQRVEVEGSTRRGKGMIEVVPERVVVLGREAIPAPVPATRQDLLSLAWAGRRVVVSGLVQHVLPNARYTNTATVLVVAIPDGTVMAQVFRWDADRMMRLLGARVRLIGVSVPVPNSSGEVVGPMVVSDPQDELSVLREPSGLETLPRTRIRDLLRYEAGLPSGPSARIEGIVTASLSSTAFFLEDDTGCVLVRLIDNRGVRPGDRCVLVGLPGMERLGSPSNPLVPFNAVFRAHELQKTGEGPLPEAPLVEEGGLADARHNHRRVRVEGIVLASVRSRISERFEVTLQMGRGVVRASGYAGGQEEVLPAVGSRVRVAGVLDQRAQPDTDEQIVRLHLAWRRDIVTLAGPPGVSRQILLAVLGGVTGLGLLTAAWAWTLRGRVRARTAELVKANRDLTVANADLAKATAAKAQFLANMSHEIRTPMNAVLGLVQVLQRQTQSAEQREILGRVAGAGQSLMRILNDILDLSKIEAGQVSVELQPLGIAALMEHLQDLFGEVARSRGLSWSVEHPDDLPDAVLGDRVRLEQVLSNLVGNAIKFTEKGYVHVRVRVVDESAEAVRLRFEVIDTGPGLTPQVQAKLFQPFTQADAGTTRRHGGTGLGLSICRRLVDLMGGRLGIESAPGKGSTLWVELPLRRDSGAGTVGPGEPSPSAPSGQRLSGRRILVVDDSPLNLDLAGRALRQEGATPWLVPDALQGLACLRQQPGRFDAVLMDLQLPVLDGLEAIRAIRREPHLKDLPVIAYTAAVLPHQCKDALAAGANDLVAKPVDLETLVSVLARWTQARPSGAMGKEEAAMRRPASAPSAACGFPEVPGLDIAHAASRLRHDAVLFRRLLGEFSREFGSLSTDMRQSVVAGHPQEMLRRVHNLSGIAGSIGALRLGESAEALEWALTTAQPNPGRLMEECLSQLDALLSEIRRLPALAETDGCEVSTPRGAGRTSCA